MTQNPRAPRWAQLCLWGLIIAYTVYFSAASIHLHQAHQTHRADLGQIDLAIWNTSQGRFVQEIKGDQISTRLTDHVEPIFAPVSLVFWLWDDVRALLVLQSAWLALGAWPLFHLAYDRLAPRLTGLTAGAGGQPSLVALTLATGYLLYPPLQAANVAEFHAMPLATPLILAALYSAQRLRWGWFAVTALLVATVQEGAALLTSALGVYALAQGLLTYRQRPASDHASRAALVAGGLVLVAGLTWFVTATLIIIPGYAAQAYGLQESPYVARFGALGDSFGDVLLSLVTRPGLVLNIALEPLRVRYLAALLAPTGFLALLAPEILLLALPLLLANLLSSFPFQYSGLLHYSAPLAAYLLAGATLGFDRLSELLGKLGAPLSSRTPLRGSPVHLLPLAWLVAWMLGSQVVAGYSPIAARSRFIWPEIDPHHQLLDQLVAQVPATAPLSTMAVIFPHLSHREHIYQFPILGDSHYVLLDIAAQSGWSTHPATLRDAVADMLGSGQWQVVDAIDGYLLLGRAENSTPTTIAQLPTAFFDFARPRSAPQFPLEATFTGPEGQQIRLMGYDLQDDIQWRRTSLVLHWQALTPLKPDTTPRLFVIAADGRELDSSDVHPLIQPLWYPPAVWPVGTTVVTHQLPWFRPRSWAIGAGVSARDTWDDRSQRWLVEGTAGAQAMEEATWVQLGIWERRDNRLVMPPTPPELSPKTEVFAGDGWSATLTGVSPPPRVAPGSAVPMVLRWKSQGPAPRDYTVLVHVRDSNGEQVLNADATPHWYGPLPTTRWQSDQEVLDFHTIDLPPTLKPGVYDVAVGWYYWETLESLALLGPENQPAGDSAVVAQIEVDATAIPRPDLCCALIPECCASQE